MLKEIKIVNPMFLVVYENEYESGTALYDNYLECAKEARRIERRGIYTVKMYEIAREINFEPIDTTTLNEGVENE